MIGDYEQRARQALKAGCDMVLVCNNRAGAEQVIDALSSNCSPEGDSVKRLSKMRAKSFVKSGQVRQSSKWQIAQQTIEMLA